MRVLIVDDNASMRSMLSALLGGQGYEVVAVLEDGSEIMETIRRTSPDLVCLDYQLPGRDGLDILREINDTASEVDVVFMTASDDASIEGRAADAGAAGFLRKPFSQSQIIGELRQVRDTRLQARAANEKSAAVPAAADPSPVATARVNPRSAVIADDNASVRSLLKGLLGGIGLDVVQLASNGSEAVAAAQRHQPRVLCLDVEMPVMSGFEALPLIRQASPSTAVVMVTGCATREFVERATALGAKGYIVKPIRPAYLEACIKNLLKQNLKTETAS
jgi:CheY-like chemotaxis protein